MLKKTLIVSALIAMTGCSTFAPSKCETQACKTADMMADKLNELAKTGTRYNDAVALAGAVADGPDVNVTMHLTGPNIEKFSQAIVENPELDKQMKRDMLVGVTMMNCSIPAFREFLKVGGSISYEINYEATQEQYFEIQIDECPSA